MKSAASAAPRRSFLADEAMELAEFFNRAGVLIYEDAWKDGYIRELADPGGRAEVGTPADMARTTKFQIEEMLAIGRISACTKLMVPRSLGHVAAPPAKEDPELDACLLIDEPKGADDLLPALVTLHYSPEAFADPSFLARIKWSRSGVDNPKNFLSGEIFGYKFNANEHFTDESLPVASIEIKTPLAALRNVFDFGPEPKEVFLSLSRRTLIRYELIAAAWKAIALSKEDNKKITGAFIKRSIQDYTEVQRINKMKDCPKEDAIQGIAYNILRQIKAGQINSPVIVTSEFDPQNSKKV